MFIAGMPVVLFSSIFILIAFVPNAFGFKMGDETVAMLMKPYGYSMGILGFLVAGTTAKALTKFTDEFSNELHVNNVGYNGEFYFYRLILQKMVVY